ncbi:hypothetical protein RHGRI_012724 [Rhododendron griersonianum]|uniref:Uncharacterized protein n=1 Tax=Rhododendron griersonianum TaxID=479676 RepID=A0AAV6KSY1_9ERIC|nr:hypothetical protein RHGRI_012724 [Rhododendron griersonianum]
MIKIGPVGRTSGRGIWAWNDGGKEKIVQIFIAHGNLVLSDLITWTYGPFGGPGIGSQFDSAFRYQLGLDRPFGGFHGYSGHYLEAIGLYVKPLTTLSNDQEKVKNEKGLLETDGRDDGGWDVIAQIFVSHGDLINSLQFQFDENGTLGIYLNSTGVYVKLRTSLLDFDKAKIASGGGAAVAFSAPAASGVAAAAAPAAAVVEEKKEEPKEESDDDMGFSLFD